ncbi:MAG: prenyltransferase [Candidatus Microsaccharimonas sp.]
MNALVKLFKVSRPISWVNTAYPFAVGYLLLGGAIDPLFIIATLFFLIPYNLVMYGINDVFDYESDIRNPRKGSIEGAVEAKSFHPVILWASLITSLPFVVGLIILSPPIALAVLLAVLFFVVAYSLKGLRFKEIPFLDSITSSIHFVGPLVFAWALFGFTPVVWPYLIAFFLWGMASHAFGAVQDIIPDRKGKLSSIATVLGARFTTLFSFLLYLAAALLVMWQGGLSVIVGVAGLLYVANVAPYLAVTDKSSAITNKGWRRFIWINYIVGAVVTMVLILTFVN